jgi:hypothetical protein
VPSSGDHLVTLGDLGLYGGMEVVEGTMELGLEPFYVFGAALEHRPVGLMGEVAVEYLVCELQLALVADLLDVTPEDGLVLFGGHAAPPSQPASLAGLASSAAMMPPI